MSKFFVSNIALADFTPTLTWPKEYKSDYRRTVLDGTTGYLFLGDQRSIIRLKFCGLIFLTPFFHGALALMQVIYSFAKVFCDLFNLIFENKDNISKNSVNILQDLINIVIAPLFVIALELTAIIGLIFPLNARKFFGSTERFMSNNFELHKFYNKAHIQGIHKEFNENKALFAPCFQPKFKVIESEVIGEAKIVPA